MRVFHSIEEASGLAGASVALGNFDGVHRGHQALFAEAARHGTPVAVTFDPHPGKVLQPELAPKLINTLGRKLELFAQYGLHAAVLQPFTRDYAATTPEQFEASLFDQLGARHVVVGGDFTYGARRAGNVETLRAAAAARGAQLHVVPPVTVDGVVVSSSRVREYILEGRVSAAERLLGRYFDLDGIVVTGKGRGRGIGFPTANVDTPNELRPAAGVYAVRAWIRELGTGPVPGAAARATEVFASPPPVWRAGAANIGVKPTFGGTEVTIEVHLIDFEGDLYGRSLRVQFVERLRPEQRFGSVTELSTQIQRDVDAARTAIARLRDAG
ncbi:MAG: bifunctional riboflavin kinase/FAD synthetase [Myxococcaceae bacterium]|nr:bifunctional riboflavin kinase/FAD synthetase [Myxococcaceae bacterium]